MTTKKGKKKSGGRYYAQRKKKLSEKQGLPRIVKLGEEKKKFLRMRGGKLKVVLLRTNKANLIDPQTKKAKVVKIENVLEVPSNQFFARQNILTKGAIILTEKGKARITNRPSQEGCVNAILIE